MVELCVKLLLGFICNHCYIVFIILGRKIKQIIKRNENEMVFF